MTSTSGAMQPLSEATTTISHQRSALSMDHHVFLLSRIRERYAQTGDNQEAVVHGIAATGRIITGAALIIIVVFAGFAAGQQVMFQQFSNRLR
jgi:uncharacterized membrane protein YdfJ with MMPL/SSD domain